MRSTEEGDHVFGSLSNRGSNLSKEERSLRREIQELENAREEVKRKEVKRSRRIGRIF